MNAVMETKDFKFALQELDERGSFKGYASIFGALDSYNDVVEPGAFKKTLRENKQFPMLWSHDTDQPLGIIRGEEDEKGLRVEGNFNMDVQKAVEIRSLVKQGAVNGLSIGYETVKEQPDKQTGARRLKEINLWEVSPCVFQACPGALISEVKAVSLEQAVASLLRQKDLGATLRDEEKELLQRAAAKINALLGTGEPDTPLDAPGSRGKDGKPDIVHLLDAMRAHYAQTRKSIKGERLG